MKCEPDSNALRATRHSTTSLREPLSSSGMCVSGAKLQVFIFIRVIDEYATEARGKNHTTDTELLDAREGLCVSHFATNSTCPGSPLIQHAIRLFRFSLLISKSATPREIVTSNQRPRIAAAFSRNSDPVLMYFLTVVNDRCRV